MIYTGLVSVTFRGLSPEDIVSLVAKAGLQGIEWGGDIHVPHGEINRAREVAKMTEDAGLCTASYGSYYYVGCQDQNALAFEQVLQTAVVLRAPTIRVWAGDRGSANADEAWWDRVITESIKIADMAASSGIALSYEYHNNTLTDTPASAVRLLKLTEHKNIRSYWQLNSSTDFYLQLKGLNSVLPWLSNIHVNNYINNEMQPLVKERVHWQQYLNTAAADRTDRFAMLEFVKGDSAEQFYEDAKVLKALV